MHFGALSIWFVVIRYMCGFEMNQDLENLLFYLFFSIG